MTVRMAPPRGCGAAAALLMGLAALAGAVVLSVLTPIDFWPAYLVAVIGWSAIPIGALGILFTYYLAGGQWALVLGEVLRGVCRTFPFVVLMFVPLVMFAGELYSWAQPGGTAASAGKAVYLSQPFFGGRTALYLILWMALAFAAMASGDPLQRHPRQRAISAVGLILWALSVTFAGIDWVMSLDPYYASSAFGWIYIADVLIAAFTFCVLITAAFGRNPRGRGPFPEGATSSLSGFLLGGILAWAYLVFFQYLVSWSGDLPHSVGWYQQRAHGVWTWLIWIIAFLQAAIPFVVLLSTRARASWLVLVALAAVILIARFLHFAWLILPAFPGHGAAQAGLMLLMLAALGGLWFGAFLLVMRPGERPLPPALEVR